jgi:hypothetical protein
VRSVKMQLNDDGYAIIVDNGAATDDNELCLLLQVPVCTFSSKLPILHGYCTCVEPSWRAIPDTEMFIRKC